MERNKRRSPSGLSLACAVMLTAFLCYQAIAMPISRALLVEVEDYPDPSYRLPGVRSDVKLLKQVLVKSKLIASDSVKTLFDKQANKNSSLSQFNKWLVNGSKPGDTVLFYFSGHGIQVWDQNNDERLDGQDEALVCWDTKIVKSRVRKDFNGKTLYSFDLSGTKNLLLDDEISDFLEKLQGRTVIFLSDSCHSGSVYKELDPLMVINKTLDKPPVIKSVFEPRLSAESPDYVQKENNNIGDDLAVDNVRLIAFTASEDSQPAQVAKFDKEPKGYHSVFTWNLYHGLVGSSDLNNDGKISFDELYLFLQKEIRKQGYDQKPQMMSLPKSLVTQTYFSATDPARIPLKRPSKIQLFLRTTGGIDESESQALNDYVCEAAPPVQWTNDKEKADGVVTVEKRESSYGARFTDGKGVYWESYTGPGIGSIEKGLVSNITDLPFQFEDGWG